MLLLCSLGNKWPLTEMFEVSLILKWLKKLTFIVAEWPRLIISHRLTTTCRAVGVCLKKFSGKRQTEIEGGFKEKKSPWLSDLGGTCALSAPRFWRPWHALFRDPHPKEMRLTRDEKSFNFRKSIEINFLFYTFLKNKMHLYDDEIINCFPCCNCTRELQ